MDHRKRVFLVGGGTLGSVTPLLALAQTWREEEMEAEFLWVGTPDGPEREVVEKEGITFIPLSVPKLDRTRPWKMLWFLPAMLAALYRSFVLLRTFRPAWVVSAGAYVAVPLGWLAPFFRVRIAIHQLDVSWGLANLLLLPLASRITATWKDARTPFVSRHVEVIGSPVLLRKSFSMDARAIAESFELDATRRTLYVVGGGTGSLFLNQLMASLADTLAHEMNVIHLAGKGKMVFPWRKPPEGYRVFDFLMPERALAAVRLADVVVSRAGMGTLAELVALHKASILIPIPHSSQEANAQEMLQREAARVLWQKEITGLTLLREIHEVLEPHVRRNLEERVAEAFPVHGAAERWVALLK